MAPFESVRLDHLPVPGDPSAPPEAHRRAAFYGIIASAATAWPFVGVEWRTALPCRRRPGGSACAGRLTVVRTEVPPEVRWRCPSCADAGVIRSFGGSCWDLRATEAPSDLDPAQVDVPLQPADLAVLRSQEGLDLPDRRTVMTALGRGREVVVWGPPGALWRLLEAVRKAARREPARRRRALARIARAIEDALVRVA